jgi:pimeloyl-ACP methyl ester carboxylesterase
MLAYSCWTENTAVIEITRKFRRMFVLIAISYSIVCILVFVFQRRLIYYPTRLSIETAIANAARNGFSPWRNSHGQTIGWKIIAKDSSIGRVLVVHGNAGTAAERDYLALPIHEALPLDVHVLEFPGYGPRAGSPNMSSILAAAEEAFDQLPKDSPIYLVSESLGTGAVAHLARAHPERVAGILMFVPYDDLANVGQRAMPLLPVRWLLRDRYQPALWLEHYRGPVVFVVAGADETIPPELGRRIHDGYRGPKQLHVIPRAGHNDVAQQSAEWWTEVFSFWMQSAAGTRPPQ